MAQTMTEEQSEALLSENLRYVFKLSLFFSLFR